MPNYLGQYPTQTTILKDFDGRDIFEEFEAAGNIEIGQPVVLDATGKLLAAPAAAPLTSIVGTSIHKRVIGESVTVATRFRAIIFGSVKAAVIAGPVEYQGFDAVNNYNQFDTATLVTTGIGFALDTDPTPDGIVRVGLL